MIPLYETAEAFEAGLQKRRVFRNRFKAEIFSEKSAAEGSSHVTVTITKEELSNRSVARFKEKMLNFFGRVVGERSASKIKAVAVKIPLLERLSENVTPSDEKKLFALLDSVTQKHSTSYRLEKGQLPKGCLRVRIHPRP